MEWLGGGQVIVYASYAFCGEFRECVNDKLVFGCPLCRNDDNPQTVLNGCEVVVDFR